MIYMGSKNRFAKELLPVIMSYRHSDQWYVEPFCGGCNLIDKIPGKRIANDVNPYLIAMWKALQRGWNPPYYTEEQYKRIRDNKDRFYAHVVGWVGFNVSYRGKFFNGFRKTVETKDGVLRDYQKEAANNTLKQLPSLTDIQFSCLPYDKISLPENSLVYCDPPYKGTTEYLHSFDHEAFWRWCREQTIAGHTVLVSEYEAPDDFRCIWSKDTKHSMSLTNTAGSWKHTTEKLFISRGVF